jgi:hypothetical protein
MISTTDFFMQCCKKILKLLGKIALLLCVCTSIASAEGIAVTKAEIRVADDGYEIWADFKITLPPSVAQALIHGVALNFVSELTITRSRWYWLDSAVTQNEQTTKLSYNALTRQYRISRGTLFQGFTNLESALRVLGHQSAPPVPTTAFNSGGGYVAKMLKSETKYTAFAQMRLDTYQLPKPLQVNALTNGDWNLESERYSWPVPADLSEIEAAAKP